jgi:hypothetical protein
MEGLTETGKINDVVMAADSHQNAFVSTRARRHQRLMNEATVPLSRNSTEDGSNTSECSTRNICDNLLFTGSSQMIDVSTMGNKVGRQCSERGSCNGEDAGMITECEKAQKRLRSSSDGVSATDTKSTSRQRPKRVISAKKLVRF